MNKDKTARMEKFIDLLDDYIDGRIESESTEEIKNALNKDVFLNEVLKQHVQARANMRVAGEQELGNKFADSLSLIHI